MDGADGETYYPYTAYASDVAWTGFSTTPTDLLKYKAEFHSTTVIASPTLSDFAAAGATWVKYIGDDGADGAGDSFNQDLNTTNDVVFNSVAASSVSIEASSLEEIDGDLTFDDGNGDPVTLAEIRASASNETVTPTEDGLLGVDYDAGGSSWTPVTIGSGLSLNPSTFELSATGGSSVPTIQSADPTSASSIGWYLATTSGDTFYKGADNLFNVSAGTQTDICTLTVT